MTPERFIAGFIWIRERLGGALSNSAMLLAMNVMLTPVVMTTFSGLDRAKAWLAGSSMESVGSTLVEQLPICLFIGCSAEFIGRFVSWLGSGPPVEGAGS